MESESQTFADREVSTKWDVRVILTLRKFIKKRSEKLV